MKQLHRYTGIFQKSQTRDIIQKELNSVISKMLNLNLWQHSKAIGLKVYFTLSHMNTATALKHRHVLSYTALLHTNTYEICNIQQMTCRCASVQKNSQILTNCLRLYAGHPVERCEAAPLIRTEDEEEFMPNCKEQ